MTRIISIVLGIVSVVIGILLLLKWHVWFIRGLQATLPVVLIFSGSIALLAGVSETKDLLKERKQKG